MDACTIIARNYLPYARVLAKSFREHHPAGRFTVLVIDDLAAEVKDESFDVVSPADLDLPADELLRMAMLYDVTELATAVKPWLLALLLDRGAPAITYLDPDIRVYAPLDELDALAREHGIVLTPHVTSPLPRDGLRPSEAEILAAGVYNLGFIAVSPAAQPMLEWWRERLHRDAVSDVTRMLFTDQRWIDFVPGCFDVAIVRDPSYNVAYWNLHGRTLDDLRFFHFSGFKPERPDVLSRHAGDAPRVTLTADPPLAELCAAYAVELRAAGSDEPRPDYGWGRTRAGLVIDRYMRRAYRRGLVEWEAGARDAEPPNAFRPGQTSAFIDWLNETDAPATAAVSRYLLALYDDRPDLRAAFPSVPGRDSARYLHWIRTEGAAQVAIADAFLPSRLVSAVATAQAALPPSATSALRRLLGR